MRSIRGVLSRNFRLPAGADILSVRSLFSHATHTQHAQPSTPGRALGVGVLGATEALMELVHHQPLMRENEDDQFVCSRCGLINPSDDAPCIPLNLEPAEGPETA